MQQAELQHHHHGAIDPNLDPVMDDQLRQLRHDLADGAHAAGPPMSAAGDLPGRPTALLRGRPAGHGNPY